jgi:hypothetical protein
MFGDRKKLFEQAKDGKVVGTCDGGTKKIVYKRGE